MAQISSAAQGAEQVARKEGHAGLAFARASKRACEDECQGTERPLQGPAIPPVDGTVYETTNSNNISYSRVSGPCLHHVDVAAREQSRH